MTFKTLTQADFVAKSRKVHGDRYDYAHAAYVNSKAKVAITCGSHGVFMQTPNSHLNGSGCPKCSVLESVCTSESFIAKAGVVHGGKYDYSLVHYQSSKIKVNIKCSLHGVFQQKPNCHLTGRGCPKCARIKKRTTCDQFIERAQQTHGLKYDYSDARYAGNNQKLTIICKEHGKFRQAAFAHLRGRGCPHCAESGYKTNKPGHLYFLTGQHPETQEKIMKVGITNNLQQRIATLKRETPFTLKLMLSCKFKNGEIPQSLEKEFHQKLTPANLSEKFDGYSEWFLFQELAPFYAAGLANKVVFPKVAC